MRAWSWGSMVFIFMATLVVAHGFAPVLLVLKMAFHAASAVVSLASCIAMASMFAWTRAESTASFSTAKVVDFGLLGIISVS